MRPKVRPGSSKILAILQTCRHHDVPGPVRIDGRDHTADRPTPRRRRACLWRRGLFGDGTWTLRKCGIGIAEQKPQKKTKLRFRTGFRLGVVYPFRIPKSEFRMGKVESLVLKRHEPPRGSDFVDGADPQPGVGFVVGPLAVPAAGEQSPNSTPEMRAESRGEVPVSDWPISSSFGCTVLSQKIARAPDQMSDPRPTFSTMPATGNGTRNNAKISSRSFCWCFSKIHLGGRERPRRGGQPLLEHHRSMPVFPTGKTLADRVFQPPERAFAQHLRRLQKRCQAEACAE